MTHTAAVRRVSIGLALAAIVASQLAAQPAQAAAVASSGIAITAMLPR